MRKGLRVLLLLSLLLVPQASALAWHDTGHMLVSQIAYLRLTPAAKARVDSLLVNADTLERVRRADDAEEIARSWQARLDEFRRARSQVLLYR